MDLKLAGKKAVVLGGTRGIGRAVADTLAEEGVDVAICARKADQVTEAVDALKAKGVNATGGSVDVTDGDALKNWIASVGEEFGGIDILVSNAGAMAQGGDEAAWKQNFDLDVLAAVNGFEAAEPFLREAAKTNGDASFVIIASIAAATADNASSYGPMKATLIHMAKGLARQHAKRGIRANTVSPGAVYFEGGVWHQVEQNMPDFFKQTMAGHPMGRMASPQDVADAAVFLASPRSSYTSGSNLIIDGAAINRVNY
ncbi:MAG: SDR family oxidoreductase [Henriciella sp.]|nr:SDR family oxidoreductase [Henriciella sp.]